MANIRQLLHCEDCNLNCGEEKRLYNIHRLMCPKLNTTKELTAIKVRVEKLPRSKNHNWRGDEDGLARVRGQSFKQAQITKTIRNEKCNFRQSDIRSFDGTKITPSGSRRVNMNYCKACGVSCGSGKLFNTCGIVYTV